MALKATIETLEGLHESIQKEYKKGDDGKFHLDVEDISIHPSVGALKRAKDREVEENKTLKGQIATLTDERDGMLKGAIPKADVDRLENSYKEKLTNQEKDFKSQLTNVNTSLNTLLVDNVAQTLASEISKVPELLLPHIRQRLRAEIVDGKPQTRVLDKDGGLSAHSLEDFKKELIANPSFAPILIASKASGSSATKAGQGGRAPSDAKVNLATMKPADLAAHMAAKKQS
jgi:hypothetical protein